MRKIAENGEKVTISDILLPYQKRFFLSDMKRRVWVSSRQVGKSFTLAASLVYKALQKDGNLSLCVSVNSRSASEIIRKSQSFAQAVKELSGGKVTFSSSFDQIRFSNGSRVLSLPSTSDSLRGFTAACVAIDEAAFIPNLDDVLQAIGPTLSRNPDSALLLASTPAGKNGPFFDIWEKAKSDPEWHAQTTTILDAANEGLDVDVESLKSLCPDPRAFEQEYMCVFQQEFGTMLDTTLLDFSPPPASLSHHSWAGIDVGRTHDRTCMSVIREFGDSVFVDELLTLDNTPYQEQLDFIARLHAQRGFTAAYVDAGGIGNAVAEFAHAKISPVIRPFTFTSSNKTPLHEAFRDLVFRKRILFRDTLRDLVVPQIANVQRIVTASGDVRYSAGRNDCGHSDAISAILLALQARKDHPASSSLPVSVCRPSRMGSSRFRL